MPEELFCVICSASQVLSWPRRILKRHQVKQTNHSYSPECSHKYCFRVFFEHDELRNRKFCYWKPQLSKNRDKSDLFRQKSQIERNDQNESVLSK
jgi:hypothetical protein